MTRLCVPLTGHTDEQMLADARAAAEASADLVELRLDYLDRPDPATIRELVTESRRLCGEVIATCRLADEGGHWDGDESTRVSLLELAGLAGADYVDFEYHAWRQSANIRQKIALLCGASPDGQGPRCRLILSRHDLEGTPAQAAAILEELAGLPGHVVKLACKANAITDALAMLDALRASASRRPTIALSMGEAGLLTRVLARKFGAFLTFASLEASRESAPGQVPVTQMRSLYRWDTINPGTRVFGVIGCPVAHSMSPAIMNAAFEATGYNGVYLPLRVEPDYADFEAFVGGCLDRPWLELRGCSVTIPHKQNLLRFVERRGGFIEPLAGRIGAANTLCIEPCGTGVSPVESHRWDVDATREQDTGGTPVPHKLYAYNTDYRGAMDALLAGLRADAGDLKDLRVAVLGAGGASRAIVAGLIDAGCRVTLYNRTAEKARRLADEFGAEAQPWERRADLEADVVINCTSIGMWPNINDTPLPDLGLPSRTVVFDTVYNPIETQLLRQARDRGCIVVDGVAMFVNQAAAQFQLWTNQSAPIDVMRRAVIQRLRQVG